MIRDLLGPLLAQVGAPVTHDLSGLALGARAAPLDPASTWQGSQRAQIDRPAWLDPRPCEHPPAAPGEGLRCRRGVLLLLPTATRRRLARAVVRWLR